VDGQDEILRFQEIQQTLIKVSRTTFWRLTRQPDFPKAFPLSPRLRGWKKSELLGWLENRREADAR
jgi:predicted DNA-binding transcriptional regulator AlpA